MTAGGVCGNREWWGGIRIHSARTVREEGGPNYDRTSVIPPRRCAKSSGLQKESISVGDTGRRAIFARCDEYGERLTAGEYEIVGECEYFRRMATYVLVI